MKFITKIGQKVGDFMLKKELKSLERSVVFNNFNSALTIGFIFNAMNKEYHSKAKDFINYVEDRGIKTFGIAYVEKSDLIGYLPYKKGVSYFGLDKKNWYGKPIDQGAEEFIKRPFDILIDISLSEIYQVKHIFALSKAKFKICNDSVKTKYADFVLKLDNKDKLELLIEQIIHYLEIIETKK
ncbi:MAG: hypothetical protein B6I20_04720 [Bacteroidetes bacterium 4572_117]|nr:MAG: hypothetical protein B6I20_04720 [Bacteroidetes bacterium 4572_117]